MSDQQAHEENKCNSSHPQKQLFDAIKAKDAEQLVQIILENPDLNLNCLDEDELTPLQHVCHTGDVEMARFLINYGAGVDFTQRKDGYTPLMFAAISAKTEVVKLLLKRGANISLENCVNRTAAQMAAFVGQTKTVSIINSWIPYETSIEPYTRRRELEDEPRIPSKNLGRLLHNLIICPSVHPIKLLLHIKENLDLVKFGSQFLYVLEDLTSKSLKLPANEESLSMKYYYLAYLLEYCQKSYKNRRKESVNFQNDDEFNSEFCERVISSNIKRLVRRNSPKEIMLCTPQLDRFIMECMMKYPYTHLAIFKTMTLTLSKIKSNELLAYAVLRQILHGPKVSVHSTEDCSICGESDESKKCGNCKQVSYCGPSCQKIDWFQHRKICKSAMEEPLVKNEKQSDTT